MLDFGEFQMTRKDGDHLLALDARRAAGESGVSVARIRFDRAAHFSGKSLQHLIFFHLAALAA